MPPSEVVRSPRLRAAHPLSFGAPLPRPQNTRTAMQIVHTRIAERDNKFGMECFFTLAEDLCIPIPVLFLCVVNFRFQVQLPQNNGPPRHGRVLSAQLRTHHPCTGRGGRAAFPPNTHAPCVPRPQQHGDSATLNRHGARLQLALSSVAQVGPHGEHGETYL